MPADATAQAAAAASAQRTPENSPDFTRPEVHEHAGKRALCRDLFAGTDAMHAKATTYLPKWAGEDTDNYQVRSTLAELYNAYARCVTAAEGLTFAKPPALEDGANAEIKAHWDDIDGMGTAARVFLRDLFRQGLQDGLPAIYVDYPRTDTAPGTGPNGALSDADRQERNLRPRWIPITTDQIVNWRIGKVNNRIELTLVVIKECVDEENGEFGMRQVDQFRAIRLQVLPIDGVTRRSNTLVTFQVWRKREEKAGDKTVIVWYVHEEGVIRPVTSIPLAVGYIGVRQGAMVATPPLLDLAWVNLGHYRVSADRRYLMSICHAPTPTIEGWTDPVDANGNALAEQPLKLGPGSALKLRGTAKFEWKQASSDALVPSKDEKDDLVAQMGSMSMAFLAQERRAQETATAHRINAKAQNATLASAAIALEDMVNQALYFHAQFMGVSPAPRVTVSISYDEDALDSGTISALNQLAASRNLTLRTLLQILQKGGVIPEDVDLETEELELLTQQIENENSDSDDEDRPEDSGR